MWRQPTAQLRTQEPHPRVIPMLRALSARPRTSGELVHAFTYGRKRVTMPKTRGQRIRLGRETGWRSVERRPRQAVGVSGRWCPAPPAALPIRDRGRRTVWPSARQRKRGRRSARFVRSASSGWRRRLTSTNLEGGILGPPGAAPVRREGTDRAHHGGVMPLSARRHRFLSDACRVGADSVAMPQTARSHEDDATAHRVATDPDGAERT